MKPAGFDYHAPTRIDEVLALLARHADAKLLAGGQSLVPVMNFRLATPAHLIDLNRVPGLAGIRPAEDGSLIVGAMTRHREMEHDPLVAAALPLARAAVRHIAHGPIRNRGTIGGSLCHADPAAEWPAVALACDAQMTIVGPTGERAVAARNFFQGLFTTAVGADELLQSIRFPAWPPGRRYGFVEVARRVGDFAIIGVAVIVDGTHARIVVFGAHDVPVLFETASLADAPAAARAAIQTRSDHHASAAYRSELVEVLVRRALQQALA